VFVKIGRAVRYRESGLRKVDVVPVEGMRQLKRFNGLRLPTRRKLSNELQ
jgi:hypothetical protein